jgi:hypothetical protein
LHESCDTERAQHGVVVVGRSVISGTRVGGYTGGMTGDSRDDSSSDVTRTTP